MKAYKIDPQTTTISTVEMGKGSYQEICRELQCDMIDVIYVQNDIMYKPQFARWSHAAFKLVSDGKERIVHGPALVTGYTEDGVYSPSLTLEQITSMISFKDC
jgi:hypothetical protein